MGTPGFIAPEQAAGKPVDGRADLFGLGCVLYLLVTGTEAFPGATSVEKLMAVRRKQPPSPMVTNRDLPEPVARLLADLLAKDPADRPRTAAEVAERLSGLMAAPAPARPAPPAPAAGRLRGYIITAAVSAALAAGLCYLLLSLGRQR
jgi:serine/threonine protein kinase